MQICFQSRVISMSVGEFSEFTDRPVSSSRTGAGAGIWRAQIGQVWHDKLRKEAESSHPDAAFEVKIAGQVQHRNWIFKLQGRADQIVSGNEGTVIREVKTTDFPLPAHDDDLRQRYRAWFLQLEAYRQLFPRMPGNTEEPPGAELVFVEYQTGFIQTVTLDESAADFNAQLERIYEFVERRREHLERLREFTFQPPFPSLRAGQESVGPDLERAFDERKVTFFEAPTGFGKTGLAFEFALNQLRSGTITRILFLTSKSTGQIQAAKQLESMLGDQETVSFLQVRNKAEHCIHSEFHCFREVCPFLDNLEERWDQSGLARAFAQSGLRIDLDRLRESGRSARICPYELTRAMLAHLDIWIGDYNYVFSPANRGLFFDQPGFNASETLLIVDEAHNLPSRVCDAFSVQTSRTDALEVVVQLEMLGVLPGLLLAWQHWLDLLSELEPCDELPAEIENELHAIAVRICDHLAAAPLDYPQLGPRMTELIMEIFSIRQLLENKQLERLLWVPEPGVLHLSCIDAAAFIAETIRTFGRTLLMSGTLAPFDSFRNACGLDSEETGIVEAGAPWRQNACSVAVDLRVDTRYRSRAKHFDKTTETVASMIEASTSPIAVFFPSYRYASEIFKRLDANFPSVRIALQERGIEFSRQKEFIDENLLLSDGLFLILGSSFAESIDQLGGKISHAMIVGPALPEVNSIQKARMKNRSELTQDEAFLEVYQIPGMQRINQALGRLVRAPGHRTKILLHCERFAEKSFLNLLHSDHRPREYLFSDDEFETWLQAEPAADGEISVH